MQILNIETIHARLPRVQVGDVLLTLDVLQLPPRKDTAQEPEHGGQQAKAAGPWQWAVAAQLVKCFSCERGGNGVSLGLWDPPSGEGSVNGEPAGKGEVMGKTPGDGAGLALG